ncbi:unannotated protein [freshwater metagenome]|uniref:Unannotated protein n=1 Tax=freshwater metagenome TaxID=449393 RepID=A0A6J7D7E9_9ZZZZ
MQSLGAVWAPENICDHRLAVAQKAVEIKGKASERIGLCTPGSCKHSS